MNTPKDYRPIDCKERAQGAGLDFSISMAFQSIVDIQKGDVFAQ